MQGSLRGMPECVPIHVDLTSVFVATLGRAVPTDVWRLRGSAQPRGWIRAREHRSTAAPPREQPKKNTTSCGVKDLTTASAG